MKKNRTHKHSNRGGVKLLIISSLLSLSVFSQAPPNQQNALNATGNVGVGTISPNSKLQVNGSMSVDSSLTVRDSAIFEKQAHMKDKIIVEGDAIIKGKLTARDDFKVLGTTKIEGPLKITNLPNVQANDTTLLFVNSNGKVTAGGPSAIRDIMYPNPVGIELCPPGAIYNNNPIWFNKPYVLWAGDPCPENIKVGINTNSPITTLDVQGNGYFSTEIAIGEPSLNPFGKVHIKNTDRAATLDINAIGNTNNYNKLIFMQYDATAQNTEIINAGKVNAHNSTFIVNGDGSFFLYNPYTSRKLLQMDGGGVLKSREIYVDLQNWPDFVFEKEYKLPTLSETERYIELNGHLPGVPSAKQMESEGLNVATANKLLMQKVEELTLHLIAQEKVMQQQAGQLQMLQQAVDKLSK